jgi:hypothetical protein
LPSTGGVTDNAGNVVNACREVLNCHNDLLRRVREGALDEASVRIWCKGQVSVAALDPSDAELVEEEARLLYNIDLELGGAGAAPPGEVLIEARDFQPDAQVEGAQRPPAQDAPANDGEDDDEPLSELDFNRAHQCFLHDTNLCILSALKACPQAHELVQTVDRVIAAFSRSTLRQQMLRRVLTIQKSEHAKKLLVRQAVTRWHTLHDSLLRFVQLYDAVVIVVAQGWLDDCKSIVELPTQDDVRAISGFLDVLREMKVVSKVLESTSNALAFLPHCVMHLLTKLAPVPDGREWQVVAAFRAAMRHQVLTRLRKHLENPNQPSLLAAVLHPSVCPFLLDDLAVCWHRDGLVEVDEDDESEVVANAAKNGVECMLAQVQLHLQTWITEAFDDDEAPPVEPQKRARFDRTRNVNVAVPAQSPSKREKMKALLTSVLGELDGAAATATYKRVQPSNESLDEADKTLRSFYIGTGAPSKWADLLPLVKLVMSLSPVSAGAERVFSAAGKINSPLRTRLRPEAVEALTVLQFYMSRRTPDLKDFAARAVQHLDSLVRN